MKNIFSAICFCFLRFLITFTVLLISQGLGDWALTWCPLWFLFVEWIDFLLSTMDGVPLSFGGNGSGGTSSSKRPQFDLNLPPQTDPEPAPLEPSSEEEESRRERELRASKEYKAVERHNDRRDTRIKEIRQRAKEIAQERGFNPDKCDAVEDAADYVASHAEELAEGEQLRYLTRLKHSLENLNSHTWGRILEEVKRWRP